MQEILCIVQESYSRDKYTVSVKSNFCLKVGHKKVKVGVSAQKTPLFYKLKFQYEIPNSHQISSDGDELIKKCHHLDSNYYYHFVGKVIVIKSRKFYTFSCI